MPRKNVKGETPIRWQEVGEHLRFGRRNQVQGVAIDRHVGGQFAARNGLLARHPQVKEGLLGEVGAELVLVEEIGNEHGQTSLVWLDWPQGPGGLGGVSEGDLAVGLVGKVAQSGNLVTIVDEDFDQRVVNKDVEL